MANNYRKSFNFRSGVQVDNDNFIVDPNGLVGIGTSIPTEFFDLRGNAKIVGLVTANNLAVSGVSTFYNDVKVGTGITFNPSTGAVNATTFYGSAGGLTGFYAVAIDGWYIDIPNSGIFTTFKVGIGTTFPQYSLQIGEDPITGTGFSVDELTGNVYTTGIITANSFVGVGTGLTDLNASNISSGTISSERLPVLPNAKIPDNFQVAGIITALGSFNGTLVGIASTARDLTSNATINIEAATVGVSTISTRLRTSGSVGVNTDVPYAAVHVVGSSSTTLHLTADTTNITLGRSLSPTGNTGGLRFGNTNGLYPSSTTRSLDIINYDTGNLNYYLHYGVSGVGTGNFNWIYAPDSTNALMTLTYGGRLGIGITNPTHSLEVNGSAQVTSLNVSGSVYATGVGATVTVRDLYILDGQNGVVDADGSSLFDLPLNFTSGISTFYDLKVTNLGLFEQKIGIGNINPLEPLHIGGDYLIDPEDAVVINSSGIGIGTTALRYGAGIEGISVTALFGSVGVGTTNPDNPSDPAGTRVRVDGDVAIRAGDLYVGVSTARGVILTSPNGTKYRLTVSNTGTLSTVLVP
jgi:hypothetical protein